MPYLGELQEVTPVPSFQYLETFVYVPFLAYLALKKEPVTRMESRIILGVAALLTARHGYRYFQERGMI